MPPLEKILSGAERQRIQAGRPLVSLTYAQSLDGSLAARRGNSLRLSGTESSRMTHKLRAAHDAILVGINTVLTDDPSLTTRHVPGDDPQPVVLDSRLQIPLDAKLFSNPLKAWVFTSASSDTDKRTAIESAGGSVYELPPNEDGRLDLGILLDRLGDLEVDSLMVEGGARVITSFLKHALADLLFVTVAPRLVGGLHAVESLLSSASETNLQVADFPQIFDMDSEKVGDDLVIWGWLHPEHA